MGGSPGNQGRGTSGYQETERRQDQESRDITLHEWGNVRADEVVSEIAGERIQVEWELDDDTSWDRSMVKLSGPAISFIGWGGRRCTRAIAEEITEHVQMQIYQRYQEEKEPVPALLRPERAHELATAN